MTILAALSGTMKMTPALRQPPQHWTSNTGEAGLSLADLLSLLARAHAPVDLHTLHRWMSRLAVTLDDLTSFIRFDPTTYQRNRVARGDHYEALVLCWLPGQRSPIHDHRGSSCAVKV